MKLASSMTAAALAAPRSRQPCPSPPETPARSARRRNVLRAQLAAACAAALLAACATSPGPGINTSRTPPPAPLAEPITVHNLQGSATIQRGVTRSALNRETVVEEGQPIQVGPKSAVQLNLGKRALFELGPNARLVVHKRPRVGDAADRATWLRLERGYLRVIWSEGNDGRNWPLEVSFARWAAKLGAGEYFFDSATDSASACAFRGEMRLSGVPESTPRAMTDPCVALRSETPPRLIALRSQDWGALRSKRALEVTLKKAAAAEAAQAIAELERQMTQQPPAAIAQRTAPAPTLAASAPVPMPVPVPVAVPPQPVATASAERFSPSPVQDEQVRGEANAEPAPAPVATAPAPDLQPTPAAPAPTRDEVARIDLPARESPRAARADEPAPQIEEVTIVIPPAEPLPQPRPPPVIVIESPPEALPEPPAPAPASFPPPRAAPAPRAEAAVTAGLLPPAPPVIVIESPPEALPEPPPPAPASFPPPRAEASVTAGLLPPAPQKRVTELSADPLDGWDQAGPDAAANSAFATTPSAQALAAPAAPATDPNEWMVNVASYSSQASAEEQVRELVAKGFKASVRAEIVRGRSSYRVVIDGMPSEAAALAVVSELDSRLGLQSAWVLRRR